ncbi:MAG: hypothetical protein ACX930_02705 [Erythrobacter sp.]
MTNFAESSDEFSDLTAAQAVVVGVAGLLALLGTLVGLAGLLIWGIKAFDMFAPGPGDAPIFVETFAPHLTVLNFILTIMITVCGVLNLMHALRWQEFLAGGWRRWVVLSLISLAAGAAFVWTSNVLGQG